MRIVILALAMLLVGCSKPPVDPGTKAYKITVPRSGGDLHWYTAQYHHWGYNSVKFIDSETKKEVTICGNVIISQQ